MKKKIILGLVLVLALSVNSCREEFLQTEPTETLANPPAQAKLNGLYLIMITPGSGSGSTRHHDDFGQKGWDIYSDLLSSDVVLGKSDYRWYRSIADFSDTTDNTKVTNYKVWRFYYKLIYATNEIIQSLGGNDAVLSKNEDRYAMGQAKALRSYAYFYLLQFYTPEYTPSSLAIPLHLDTGTSAKPKSTQQEIYTQITNDLKESITLLNGFQRPHKGMIDEKVAEGILAYVYAAIGENQKSTELSKKIIASYPITTNIETVRMQHNGDGEEQGGGFNDLATRSWMWGVDITSENKLGLISWWGQMDIYTFSYAFAGDFKAIDKGLYDKIKDGDIRKNQFVTIGKYTHVPANKFFAPERRLGGQRVVTTDYLYMRVDEFHLLAAETLAKSNNDMEAKQILKNFMKNRFNDATKLSTYESEVDNMDNTKLLEEIYLNTRIELWGEGKTYLALKRNKKTILRGDNHLYNNGESIPHNDRRLHLKVPQDEIINNPYIGR